MRPSAAAKALEPAARSTQHSAARDRWAFDEDLVIRSDRDAQAREREALDFCLFQLGTVRGYMESPGSAELEEAYKRYVRDPDVNR